MKTNNLNNEFSPTPSTNCNSQQNCLHTMESNSNGNQNHSQGSSESLLYLHKAVTGFTVAFNAKSVEKVFPAKVITPRLHLLSQSLAVTTYSMLKLAVLYKTKVDIKSRIFPRTKVSHPFWKKRIYTKKNILRIRKMKNLNSAYKVLVNFALSNV